MFTVSKPIDLNVLLSTSPLIRGLVKTAEYVEKYGSIGLTKFGAFNRKFVEWSAREFDWPGYSEAELYRIQKVLNEDDYPSLGDIHALLLHLKLGRKYKDTFRLTVKGKELLSDPCWMIEVILPAFLLELDHGWHLRPDEPLFGNWDIYLNVINVEADKGCSFYHVRETFFGENDSTGGYDAISGSLFITVIRPLWWAGLLNVTDRQKLGWDMDIMKTSLWRDCLRLDTDHHL